MYSNQLLPKGDYYAYERKEFSPSELHKAGPWDFLLSAYDDTDRVQQPFHNISATHKQWLIHEEYRLPKRDHPAGAIELSASFDPPAISNFVRTWADKFKDAKVCVDSTGFIRPHLLVLLGALRDIGVLEFDVLYSDPVRYVDDENTEFTIGPVVRVEQIPGYEGVHRASGSGEDLLVIGAGYNYRQITSVCEEKRNSQKYILTGLPSLQPHMYQESVLRIHQAAESIGYLTEQQRLYASANNPFTVAQALQDLFQEKKPVNLYLCPVGPKPHVLGFAIFYLRELKNAAASVIYPFPEGYSRQTSQGLRRTWQYRVEL